MPSVVSLSAAPRRWSRSWRWPMTPSQEPPTTTNRQLAHEVAEGRVNRGGDSENAAQTPSIWAGSTVGGSLTAELRPVGRWWAARLTDPDPVESYVRTRMPWWRPALAVARAPYQDDDTQTYGWLRLYVWSDSSAPGAPGPDEIGHFLSWSTESGTGGIAPPTGDGSYWAPLTGGIGIVQLTGTQDWAYRAWDPAGTVIDGATLGAYDGWHTVDLITRQAQRGDPDTPWLTVLHDGQIVRERVPYGSATLASPQAIDGADAHACVLMSGAAPVPSAGGWESIFRWQWRIGDGELPRATP